VGWLRGGATDIKDVVLEPANQVQPSSISLVARAVLQELFNFVAVVLLY
jgi:hypothetical protein